MSESTAQRPLTGRKLKEALQKGYSDARGEVLLPLIKLLRTHLLDVWVPVADLFGEEMLPEKITKRSFSRAFWEKADEEHEGVRVYKSGDDDRYILLRYKHSDAFLLQGAFVPGRNNTVKQVVNNALQILPGAISGEQLGKVTQPLKAKLASALAPVANILNAKPQQPSLVTPAVKKIVQNINTGVTEFAALSTPVRKAAAPQLLHSAHHLGRLTGVVVPNKPCAMRLLDMFREKLSRKSFVERILRSKNVKAETGLFPLTSDFSELSESNQANAVDIVTEVAIQMAKLILPQDEKQGAGILLNRMTENAKFRRFALPSCKYDSNGFRQFKDNPVVAAIKT